MIRDFREVTSFGNVVFIAHDDPRFEEERRIWMEDSESDSEFVRALANMRLIYAVLNGFAEEGGDRRRWSPEWRIADLSQYNDKSVMGDIPVSVTAYYDGGAAKVLYCIGIYSWSEEGYEGEGGWEYFKSEEIAAHFARYFIGYYKDWLQAEL